MPAKKEETTSSKAPAKTTTTKKATTRKTTTPKTTSSISKKVAENARHIAENHAIAEWNSKMIHVLYGTIILLLLIIAGLSFFVGTKLGSTNAPAAANSATLTGKDIKITVIDDARCTECPTENIVSQLETAPFLSQAEYEIKDFADKGVKKYLEDNAIKTLPAVIFNSNLLNDGGQITPFLAALPNGEFSLSLGSTFDPFQERSENGFLILDQETLAAVKADAHYAGNTDAKITWLEYTDVNCHYCKKMKQDGTVETVREKFPEILNKTTSNFIGVGGAASQKAAEILECAASDTGADLYNALMAEVLTTGDNSEETMLTFISENGGNKDAVKSCLDNGEAKETVSRKFTRAQTAFGITGTPGNVIINNETGEYQIISGAYPAESFIESIEKMTK